MRHAADFAVAKPVARNVSFPSTSTNRRYSPVSAGRARRDDPLLESRRIVVDDANPEAVRSQAVEGDRAGDRLDIV